MKVIVTGTRQLDVGADEVISEAMRRSGFLVRELVSSDTEGAADAGERWAAVRRVPVVKFRLKREQHGRDAWQRQARELTGYADALVLVWLGWEQGWRQLVDMARFRGLQVFELRVERRGSRANGVWGERL